MLVCCGLFFCSQSILFVKTADAQSIIRDTEIELTLNSFLKPVLEQASINGRKVDIKIVDSMDINAFVAGGHNIFFYTGLLLETENPEELIGVMAHETSHISLGHLIRLREAMEHASAQSVLASVLGIMAAIGTGKPEAAAAVSMGGQSMAMRQFLSHTRIQESSADQSAVKYLQSIHVPLTGMLSFMQKLESQELLPSSQQSKYIRTHPLTQDRISFLEHAVETMKVSDSQVPAIWNEWHKRMQAKLTGFLFPDKALRLKGDSIASIYARSIAYYRKNEIKKSLSLLELLLEKEPDNPYFYELKAQVLLESGRVSESIPFYKRAVSLLPEAGLIRVSLAHALLEAHPKKEKEFLEIITHLKTAEKTENRSPRLQRLLATAYGRIDKEGLSRVHLAEEALLQNRLQDANKQAHLALGHLEEGSASWLRVHDLLRAMAVQQTQKKH